MGSSTRPDRTAGYKPALAAFAAFACVWVFVLVTLGAFTTSINAGMAFPDWPLSDGSLNPTGWLSDLAMFAEHSHRLSAGVQVTCALVIAFWLWRVEARRWLRGLGWFAFGLVVLQAVIGGLRVKLDPIPIPAWGTNVGEIFAMLHAWVAQVFICTLLAIALSCSREWIAQPLPLGARVLAWGRLCCGLLLINLVIAAIVRHSFAGLAIPYFPFSTRDHHLLPPIWSFKIGIHFAHRIAAVLIAIATIVYAALIWRDPSSTQGLKTAAAGLLCLLVLQIWLGALIIATFRDPFITTAHVLVGALTLATTFGVTWFAHRDRLQS